VYIELKGGGGHYSEFHLSDVQWLSGDDNFIQSQLGNVQVSCHS
jgi:hypothetical protein